MRQIQQSVHFGSDAQGEQRKEAIRQLCAAVGIEGQRGPGLSPLVCRLADAYLERPGFAAELKRLLDR